MKTKWIVGTFAGLALTLAVGPTRASAQAEIDPDHYETLVTPPHQPKTEAKQAAAGRVRSDCQLTGKEKPGDCALNTKRTRRGRIRGKGAPNVAVTEEKKLP